MAILGILGGGAPPLKMSGIGHLWFLGLCRTFCNILQLGTFPDHLTQFWGYREVLSMTTLTRCNPADHQFLVQEVIPDNVIPLEVDYFPARLHPLGSRSVDPTSEFHVQKQFFPKSFER